MIAPDYKQYKEYIDQVDADMLELIQLREEIKGPDGFTTWKDAALDERIKRVAAERKLKEISEVAKELIRVGFDPNPTHRISIFGKDEEISGFNANVAIFQSEEFWTGYFAQLYDRCSDQGERIKEIIESH